MRDTFVLEAPSGEELYTIQERKLSVRDKMDAKGNIVDHEFEIRRGGDKVAEISKRWFRVRDT